MAALAAEMTPYVSAAVEAYGGAVRDEAADATVGLGRRLLQRVFGRRGEGEPLPGPLADLADDPGDEDALAAVRLAMRTALINLGLCLVFRFSRDGDQSLSRP